MFRTRDPQLLRRAAAARAVLLDVEPEDRLLLLSLVCWPPGELLVAERAAAEDEAAFSAAFGFRSSRLEARDTPVRHYGP